MSNLMINIIDEALDIGEEEQREGFMVTNDLKADWCLDKIREHKEEYKRFETVAKDKIQQLQEVLKREKEKMENEVSFFESKLQRYFHTVEDSARETKTQKSYKLPSGQLIVKFPNPQFKRDNNKLAEWLENNEMNQYIQVKKQAKWGELKKATDVVNGQVVVRDTGELVEGIEVVERDPEFQVKL